MTDAPRPAMLARRALLAAGAAALPTSAAAQGIVLGPAPEEPSTVPFVYEGGHILIKLGFASGEPAPFVLDTGASLHVIDSGFAAKIHLASSGNLAARGAGGRSVSASAADDAPARPGLFTLTGQPAVIIDMPNPLLDRGTRPRIAGLLGAPAFTSRIIRINVARRELTILPPGSPPAAGGYQVPLSIDYGAATLRPGQLASILNGMTLNIDLDGSVLPVVLDTGYTGTLFLPHDMAEQTGALKRYPKYLPVVVPGGIDGRLSVLETLGTRLSIGGAEIASPLLEINRDAPPRHIGRWPRRPDVALLGMGILQHFTLFIDVPNSRLVLEPGGVPQHSPVVLRGPGLSAAKTTRDAFEILSVLKGSPADRAGLSPGMRIVAINGTPATELSQSDLLPASSRPDTSIVFTLADGRHCPVGLTQLLP
jgi:hypothetical protein